MSFNRSGYIGRAPGDSAITIAKQYYQPTGVQTDFTFSSGYSPGLVDVYRNGVKLINVLDYAATDGSTISLDSPVGVGSTVQVVAYKAFNLATVKATELDTTVTGTDLTLGGDLTVSDLITTVDINVSGSATVSGTVVAGSFSGDGSNLTGLATTETVRADTLTVAGVSTFTGAVDSNATTDSTSSTTGAITAAGGVGIAKDLFVGDAIDVTKDLKVGAAATITGALTGSTGTFSGAVNIDATTDSTSTTTGALIVDGGLGVAKNVYIGAGLSVAGTLTYEDVTNVDSVGLITAKSGVNVSGGQLQVGVAYSVGAAGVCTAAGLSIDSDSNKIFLGADKEMQVFHDGTSSVIKDTRNSGTVKIQADNFDIIDKDASETMLSATVDGAVTLRYNGNQKFVTTDDGTRTSGIHTATLGIDAAISVWTLGASGTSHYTFTGPGNLSATTDPTLNLKRGQKYTFKNRSGGHPFRIQSTPNGSAGTAYNTGVTNNDGGDGTNIIFDVPYNAPNVLYYQCTAHGNMGGAMYIDGSGYEISVGSGVTIGSAGVSTFSGTSDVHLLDNVRLNVGDGSDLAIYHNGTDSYIKGGSSGELVIRHDAITMQAASSTDTYFDAVYNAGVTLKYDNSTKFATTNEGIEVTGFTSTTAGMGVTGGLFEGSFIKAGKLSDNATLGISTANFFYFTTQETTTATPNIVWNDSYSLSSKMAVGDVASVTVITTAAAAGYCANWTIDGNAVTEEWVGGSAPSEGGSDGLDIYVYTIICIHASNTGDSGFKVIANYVNATN